MCVGVCVGVCCSSYHMLFTQAGSRGRLTFVIEKSYDLRDALTRFLDKSEAIGPIPEGLEDQETIDR